MKVKEKNQSLEKYWGQRVERYKVVGFTLALVLHK
jgi:hypothetical protein